MPPDVVAEVASQKLLISRIAAMEDNLATHRQGVDGNAATVVARSDCDGLVASRLWTNDDIGPTIVFGTELKMSMSPQPLKPACENIKRSAACGIIPQPNLTAPVLNEVDDLACL